MDAERLADVRRQMAPMLAEARERRMMIASNSLLGAFQWWPAELEKEWERGQFGFDAINFRLVDPADVAAGIDTAAREANDRRYEFYRRWITNGRW